ncbi:methyladenine glycosylase [Desulfovibrio sp. X2]|uniref:DNA-3-methyladenine glycosylase I n=1 Tax=Desulfovibrio sp. X2 TaxID=941449 RepID=UPI000358F0C9|nr:DNA-3-methyladenine glycosylase I [Desulfovibrio sp. X2]EPR39368.1 methyladenine glycosylase [Desulfovibrio sp. X2]
MVARCPWSEHSSEERLYHDTEWGVPLADDRRLFEFLVLDAAQAGLSWLTVLRKREGYRRAFADFDANAVALYNDAMLESLLQDPGIVRNRQKVASARGNARAVLEVSAEKGSLAAYVWGFVDGRPVQNAWTRQEQVPAVAPAATAMSKDMKRRGFSFCGPTICYAFMQAAGLVNDHLTSCFRYEEIGALGESFRL